MSEKIILATLEIFREKGVKFTMDDISKKLGISKRTLYLSVENKEDLINIVIQYIFKSIKEQELVVLENKDMEDLEKLKRILLIQPYSFKDIAYSKIYQMKAFYPKLYQKVEERLESDWTPTVELMKGCIKAGKLKDVNIELLKNMINGSIEKILENDFLEQTNTSFDQALYEIIEILFQGLEIRET